MKPTGWPPGLMQDDSRELSRWFASRIDARRCVRVRVMEIFMNTEQKTTLTPETIKCGGHYNWRYQPERLIYVGLCPRRVWHQFEKVGKPGTVWCEVLGSDLDLLEETKP